MTCAAAEAEKQNVSSIVIDLRSNGGGALTEAVSLSGLFRPARWWCG
jgi:carboxyl-terminal processing protease